MEHNIQVIPMKQLYEYKLNGLFHGSKDKAVTVEVTAYSTAQAKFRAKLLNPSYNRWQIIKIKKV